MALQETGPETGVINGKTQTLPISNIAVSQRFRKHLRGIDELAASIEKAGLLHPVVVTTADPEEYTTPYLLIAGQRRIEACKQLGWTEIPAYVVPLKDNLLGQHEENVQRQDFTPSEIAAIVEQLEPEEREEAKKRQGRRGRPRSGKLPTHAKSRVRDHVAKIAGKSRRTVDKIVAVTDAAEENPDLAPVVEEMDQTGKVDAAYKKVRAVTSKTSERDRRVIALWKALSFLKGTEDEWEPDILIRGIEPEGLKRLAESLEKRIAYLQAVQKAVTEKIKDQKPVDVLA